MNEKSCNNPGQVRFKPLAFIVGKKEKKKKKAKTTTTKTLRIILSN